MLAVVACVEPAAARWLKDWWSEHEIEIRVPKIPVVLKVRSPAASYVCRVCFGAMTLHPGALIPLTHLPSHLQEGLEFSFTPLELVLAVPASLFCGWYYRRRHWFANNVLGLAFR